MSYFYRDGSKNGRKAPLQGGCHAGRAARGATACVGEADAGRVRRCRSATPATMKAPLCGRPTTPVSFLNVLLPGNKLEEGGGDGTFLADGRTSPPADRVCCGVRARGLLEDPPRRGTIRRRRPDVAQPWARCVGTANGRWFANGAQALLRCNAANATCTRHRAGLRGHEYQFSVRSLLFFLFIFWDLK